MNTKVYPVRYYLLSNGVYPVIPRLIRNLYKLLAITIFLFFGASPAFASELANQFSISLWVYPQTSVVSKALAVKNTEIRLYTDASGYANCQIYTSSWQTGAVGTTALPLNTWSHVSCTYDKANIKIYVGGILQNSVAQTAAVNDAATNWRVGSDEAGTYGDLTGTTDEFKIYSYARTQKQIVEDMLGGGSVIASGARQSASATVGYWKFDEGQGITANNSGNGGSAVNGTVTNATWSNSGKFGKALSFDGTGDYVNLGTSTNLNSLTSAATVSLWVNPSNTTTAGLVDRSTGGNGALGPFYLWWQNSKFRFSVATGATSNNAISSSTYTPSNWYHVVGTFDGTNVKTYVNGILTATTSQTVTPVDQPSSAWIIGAMSSPVGTNSLAGLIDEVKIYNYALTSDEVKTDYNHGLALSLGSASVNSSNVPLNSSSSSYCVPGSSDTCSAPVGEWNFEEGSGQSANDTSGNSNTGTLGSSASSDSSDPSWTTGKLGKALSFDGGDYVTMGDVADVGAEGFTLSAWVKTGVLDSAYHHIISKNQASYPNYQLFLNNNNRFRFASEYQSGDATSGVIASSLALSTDTWYHVVGVRDISLCKAYIYVNGVLINSATLTTCAGNLDNNQPLNIGRAASSLYWNGSIDGVKIFNYARTPAQIAWDYNRGGPVGHWKFDECQGSTVNSSNDPLSSSNSPLPGTLTVGSGGTQTSVGNCSTSATTAWYSGRTGKYNSSLNFDGTDDYVSLSQPTDLDFAAPGTISTWVKTSADSCLPVYSVADADAPSNAWMLFAGNSCTGTLTDELITISRLSGGNTTYILGYTSSTRTELIDGNWHNIVVTADGSSVKIYLDGRQKTVTIGSGPNDGSFANVSNVDDASIGSRVFGGNARTYYNGQIDDVQIFNYALTPLQVKTLFNENSSVRFGPSSGAP